MSFPQNIGTLMQYMGHDQLLIYYDDWIC
uniref:Uncharacterized protein n=1 Tax=Rhizophora mucronata TaxID=61149 RepID=A0A2P2QPI1_RHIMU